MRIGIDAREIKNPDTGTGMYVVNLIRSISLLNTFDNFILFVNKGSKIDIQLPENFEYYEIKSLKLSKIEDQVIIPFAILKSRVDIFHVIHHDVTPLLTLKPIVVTVLDIAWIDFPGTSSKLFQFYYKYLTKFALIKAKRVITISESTKQKVLKHFPYIHNKIQAIPIACDISYSNFENTDIFEQIANEFQIKKPYVLYVGSFAMRKNVNMLFEAMKHVWKDNSSIQLVLAGKPSGKDDFSVEEVCSQYPVILISRTKTKIELKNLYINASVFVFPSLYEGFGLPVLEAMTCGCPIIALNTTSIPEIVGNTGTLLESDDIEGMAISIKSHFNSEIDKNEREESRLDQAKKFTWEKVAEHTFKNYQKANSKDNFPDFI